MTNLRFRHNIIPWYVPGKVIRVLRHSAGNITLTGQVETNSITVEALVAFNRASVVQAAAAAIVAVIFVAAEPPVFD